MVPRQEPLRPPPPPREPSNSKASFLSPTPSFEADDENSSLDYRDMDSQGHDPATHNREPQYPGEDTRWTSQKEIWGWLSYGWAAEVFVVCGIGSFLPITLEQLARERGVLLSDHATPCQAQPLQPIPTLVASATSNAASSVLSSLAARSTSSPEPQPSNGQCVVTLLGAEINTASFALYTFSLSVFVQAIVIISMSGAADHGDYRKRLLLSFAFVGAIATMLFLPIVPAVYVLGALLAIIANTCFGASFVLLNAFLPVLVRNHPSIYTSSPNIETASVFSRGTSSRTSQEFRTSQELESHHPDLEDSTTALLTASHNHDPYDTTKPPLSPSNRPQKSSPELALSTRLSSQGIGIGYTAAVLVQILAVFLLVLTSSTTFSFRLVLFVIGTWWLLFTIPAALFLRPRPGPPIPNIPKASGTSSLGDDLGRGDYGESSPERRSSRTWAQYIAYAWTSLFRTILRARQLKDTMLFLGAWFLLSDGIATISGTAVLFAKTELHMKPAALALINVIVTLAGIGGAFAWRRVSSLLRLSPVGTIFACICMLELIPLYGLLGYIPAVRRYGAGGLQAAWEMYPLGAVYGFVLGGLGAYCRAVFGELIPPGSEAGFYALYAITDKGSSVFGPAVVGAITDRWGGIRPAFVFLAVLIGGAVPLIGAVDVRRGKKEAAMLARGEHVTRGDEEADWRGEGREW